MKHYEIEEKMFTDEEDEYNMKDNEESSDATTSGYSFCILQRKGNKISIEVSITLCLFLDVSG